MLEVNRIGFTELVGTEGAGGHSQGNKRVNIILVHGLRGHPYKTWASSKGAGDERAASSSSWRLRIKSHLKPTTSPAEDNSTQEGASSRQQEVFWPKDYLANDIREARVWIYGYNVDVIGGLFQANNKNSVSGHGRDLKARLEREISNEDPIIFVAHSLGGIIVKDALFRSEACRKRTKLVVFLGTPRRGSTLASWGEIASNLARLALQDTHKKIIETLEVNSEVLDNIHDQFLEIVHYHDIQIHSFQEAQGITGMKGLHEKVVDDFSSKIGLPGVLETPESIDANHMQMVKCKDRSDESYRAIAGVLKQFLKKRSTRSELSIRSATQIPQEGTLSARQETDTSCATTSYYSIPFPPNRWFVGRTKKLKELEEKLVTHDDCQKVALVGLGGIGKTQVALKLAYTVKKHRPEYSIFWVSTLSTESFEQAYRDVATRCSITLNPKDEDPKESVRRYLNSDLAGKWLLVVDNADDQDVLFGKADEHRGVKDYLPDSENGLTLFTTRHREIAVSLVGSEIVVLQEMDQKEAEAFLVKSLIQKELLDDEAGITALLNELTFLPLAIAQAAAYLNAMQISIQEYLSLLRSTEQETISLLSREFRDGTRYKSSEHSKNAVATTWLVSFNQIRRSDSVAADLLSFMSRIENKAIPRSIMPLTELNERTVHAIGTLRAYAFVTKRGAEESYDMHRLVHLTTKVWLDQQNALQKANETVAVHFAEIFPSDDYTNRTIWREYFPHAFRLLQNTKMLDIAARYDLCMAVGRCLLIDGRIGEAVDWLSECFLWRRGRYLEDHPDRLASQHALAIAYRADGQVKKAVNLLEQVVAIKEKVLKEDHPSRLASQHELAIAYRADGQVKKAVNLLEQVVAIMEKVLKEDHPSRLISERALLSSYAQQRSQQRFKGEDQTEIDAQ
ncbi:hypothetical protein MMC17_004785 [Xylographa soralifera]|nr:hypothetical protein [Xylographa soralifera]